MTTRQKRITLYATETTSRQIQSLKKRYDLTTAAVIRQAVAKWYESEPAPDLARGNGGRLRRHAPAGAARR